MKSVLSNIKHHFSLLAEGCGAAGGPGRGAPNVSKSEDAEGREAERLKALFSSRVRSETGLPGQSHLRTVRGKQHRHQFAV